MDSGLMLKVLSAVEADSHITQRRLSHELGIALGLANSYLRRCVRKGLVKITQAPLNRYTYYLTPQGFAEKGRLAATYLSTSLDFYRRARGDCADALGRCAALSWRRLVFVGASELAEIALLSAFEADLDVVAVVDARLAGSTYHGRRVLADLRPVLASPSDGIDAVLITDIAAPQRTYDEVLEIAETCGLAPERIVLPRVLTVSRVRILAEEAAL